MSAALFETFGPLVVALGNLPMADTAQCLDACANPSTERMGSEPKGEKV